MRRAGQLIACLAALFAVAPAGFADSIRSARYIEPTHRYTHGVLGDAIEHGALELQVGGGVNSAAKATHVVHLPQNRVFEDTTPRLADVDQDGTLEAIVVETHVKRGAQLAIYNAKGRKIAATPHIGQTHRWLAPIGAADLDGDGHIEIAYIDRPHLAKTLRIWRYKNRKLTEVAILPGLTNHKIGWDHIPGGIRDCSGLPELITANADWSRIMVTRFDAGKTTSREIGDYAGPDSLNAAMTCP